MAIAGFERSLSGAAGPQPAPAAKKKDFWTDQISTGGGIGGALGGAAIGAGIGSVVPVIGTAIGGLAGGIIGGALGSGAGEATENIITGDDLFKNVGQEAILGGVFSAPPIRLARGIGGAVKAAGTGGAKQAFEQGLSGAARTRGAIQRGSEGLLGKAWGVRAGEKIGTEVVTPQRAGRLQQFITDDIGVPRTANSEMVFERAVNAQQDTGEAIATAIRSANVKSYDPSQTYKAVQNSMNKTIGVDVANNQAAQDILSLVRGARTPEDLWNVRRQIDSELINWGRNPQSITPGTEQVARAARREISDALARIAPEIKSLNGRYGDLSDVIELTAKATRTPMGFNLPVFNRPVGGSTAQRLRAGAGSAAGRAQGAIGQTTPVAAATGGTIPLAARQIVGRGIAGSTAPEQPATLEDSLLQAAPMTSGFEQPLGQSSAVQTPYSQENLLYDIQRDPLNAEGYIAYYQSLQEVFNPASTQKPMSAEAARSYSNVESALSSIDGLTAQLQSDPGIQRRSAAGQVLNPLGITTAITGTGSYDADRSNLIDVIGRLRTGAAISQGEEERFQRLVPQPFDDEATTNYKLSLLRQAFQTVADRVNGSSAGTDLQSALMQASGGGF